MKTYCSVSRNIIVSVPDSGNLAPMAEIIIGLADKKFKIEGDEIVSIFEAETFRFSVNEASAKDLGLYLLQVADKLNEVDEIFIKT